MQFIDVTKEDEYGKIVSVCKLESGKPLNYAEIFLSMTRSKDSNRDGDMYSLLGSIDPYGSTLFNALQIPRVMSELKLLKESNPSENVPHLLIETLLKFIETFEAHEYLRFKGD